jgi:hypothetical protein
MARGRSNPSLESAPIRSSNLAQRLTSLANRLNERAQILEESSEEKARERHAWKVLKDEGVPTGERIILRIRSRWGNIISKNNEHQATLQRLQEEYFQQQMQARDSYLDKGKTATPVAAAWQAALVYQPINQGTESTPKTKVEAEEPVSERELVAAATRKPRERVNNRTTAPQPAQVPTQVGGVPLKDIVAHDLDDELGVEIPKLVGNGKEDDEMASWLRDFEQWDEYHSVTRGENELKRRIVANILRAYHANPAIARDNSLKMDDVVQVLAESGVSQGQAATLYWIMRHDPEKMQRALRALAPDGVPVDERINNFCEEIGEVRNAYYRYKGQDKEGFIGLSSDEKSVLTDGGKLALASVLLFAIHGEKTPPYRHQMAQGAYQALGIPKPPGLPTAKKKLAMQKAGQAIYPTPGDMYTQYLGLTETVAQKMGSRGARGDDRLSGYEAMLWTIDGPKWHRLAQKNRARFPKWDSAKVRAFLAWSDRVKRAG